MKQYFGRSLQAVAAIFTSFLIFAFADLAWNGFISDSEIWAVTLAKNFQEEWHQPWVFSRIFFYGPLALGTAFFNTAPSIFEAAKFVMFLNGLLIVFFAFRLTRRLSNNEGIGATTPWLAVIFIFANSGFLNQGYRIRSDLISCTLVLLALLVTFNSSRPLPPKKLIFWALPFLATPKAALHVFPAINMLERKRVLPVIFMGFFLTVLIFPSAITFFLSTYSEPEARMGFFSAQRFEYVNRLFTNDGAIVFAFVLRFATLFARLRSDAFESDIQRVNHRSYGLFCAASLVVLILSPEKVPFFVASFIPIFSIFTSLLIDDVLALLKKSATEVRKRLPLALLIIAIPLSMAAITLQAGLQWKAFRENNSSNLQMIIVRALESYLNRFPKATYYDVVGLVPQRASIRLFAGPNDPIANRNSYISLESLYKPDLIMKIRKTRYLQPHIDNLIKKDYFPISDSVFARWHRLPHPLSLPIKNEIELDLLLSLLRKWAGISEIREFTVLLATKGKPDRIIQVGSQDLLNSKMVGTRSQITAISPFTRIDPVTNMLPDIIRFDWDWTGAMNWLDEEKNIPPLPNDIWSLPENSMPERK